MAGGAGPQPQSLWESSQSPFPAMGQFERPWGSSPPAPQLLLGKGHLQPTVPAPSLGTLWVGWERCTPPASPNGVQSPFLHWGTHGRVPRPCRSNETEGGQQLPVTSSCHCPGAPRRATPYHPVPPHPPQRDPWPAARFGWHVAPLAGLQLGSCINKEPSVDPWPTSIPPRRGSPCQLGGTEGMARHGHGHHMLPHQQEKHRHGQSQPQGCRPPDKYHGRQELLHPDVSLGLNRQGWRGPCQLSRLSRVPGALVLLVLVVLAGPLLLGRMQGTTALPQWPRVVPAG